MTTTPKQHKPNYHNSQVITAVSPLITIPAPLTRPFTVAALGESGICIQCRSPHVTEIDGGGRGCIECGQVYIPVRHSCCLEELI